VVVEFSTTTVRGPEGRAVTARPELPVDRLVSGLVGTFGPLRCSQERRSMVMKDPPSSAGTKEEQR
jgi:hypothetical protein